MTPETGKQTTIMNDKILILVGTNLTSWSESTECESRSFFTRIQGQLYSDAASVFTAMA